MKPFKGYLLNPLVISLVTNAGMVIARMIYAHDPYYVFLIWNLFLAGIPLLISRILIHRKTLNRFVLAVLLYIWLLFLPNAPYIVTDMVHLYQRSPVPFWYDMFLVLLSAINGMVMGFISIKQTETVIRRHVRILHLNLFRVLVILAMSYGVYVGRYLRFNSWDAFIKPVEVVRGILESVHPGSVGFVITFSFINLILYSFFRTILLFRTREVV
jgi:uncharacterized membrane protein